MLQDTDAAPSADETDETMELKGIRIRILPQFYNRKKQNFTYRAGFKPITLTVADEKEARAFLAEVRDLANVQEARRVIGRAESRKRGADGAARARD